MAENDKIARIETLLGMWKDQNDVRKQAETKLAGIREEILELMDVSSIDVGGYHVARKKNYGNMFDRMKNVRENRFTWTILITEKPTTGRKPTGKA
jgi:hypothetical protein